MRQVNLRPDPAPSRWSYRFQRLMLTPRYRFMLRVGLPVMVVLAVVGGYFADPQRREAIALEIAEIRNQIETRPEFMVNLMAIDGASLSVAEDIREIVPIDFPLSSFDLELEDIRMTVAELSAVAEVSVRIRPGGVLQIEVTERQPVVIWRTHEGLALLDASGVVVRPADAREDHPELPLVAGLGAETAVAQAQALFRAAGPLGPRVRGLVRMGERRWDVVLDRDQRILLPEDKPVQALERVIALTQAQDMLARDLVVIDMRLAARPTIRMAENAVEKWWQIQEMRLEADGG